jgi:hypothetical protein
MVKFQMIKFEFICFCVVFFGKEGAESPKLRMVVWFGECSAIRIGIGIYRGYVARYLLYF